MSAVATPAPSPDASCRPRTSQWKITYAYGDHHSDYDTLDAADHPVAVHPSFSLWRAALRLDWPIELWR